MSDHLIPCREAVRQLWDYLEGAISDASRAQIEAHVAFCRRCCGELEFVERLRSLLESQTTSDGPPETMSRLEHFIDEL
ncbi:zf-HC2 domain-containing protein [Hoyosella sp. YIM 151337]|uniref:anti-sigma factor family protein n=1 Tax=Hoyosella sp. YIM 151337 TaxID=2992742 RepID=UPI002235DA86|nr:zf-HC2 domain-containing protein [Hoyosella sp. YIM 151337]MCW4354249.1 zf-HC2 domain-containing protein [Hoyosella sp. YIM 151337]